jgi:hypothetical protein
MKYQSPVIEIITLAEDDILTSSIGILLPLDPANEGEI